MVLLGLREVADNDYAAILEKAGLAKYLRELPADDLSPTIRRGELSRLYAATFQVAGEASLRRFLLNYGQRMANGILSTPLGQEMKAGMVQVQASARLGTAIKMLADNSSRIWAFMSMSEDSAYYYLEAFHCTACAGIRGAREPICGNFEYALGKLASELSGNQVIAQEIECAASGAQRCKFRFRK
jgi:predicted hydrocarbon binding protein